MKGRWESDEYETKGTKEKKVLINRFCTHFHFLFMSPTLCLSPKEMQMQHTHEKKLDEVDNDVLCHYWRNGVPFREMDF